MNSFFWALFVVMATIYLLMGVSCYESCWRLTFWYNIVSVLPFALFVGTISMEEIGLSLRVATHAYHTLPMAKYSLPWRSSQILYLIYNSQCSAIRFRHVATSLFVCIDCQLTSFLFWMNYRLGGCYELTEELVYHWAAAAVKMIGGLFIYNHKGEVLISRVYRDDIGLV